MKKKGFTLIELLAVIVILAIIAIIATPTILGVIETARKGAAESSALGYIDAVEKQVAIGIVTGEEILDGTYNVSELNVSYKGEQLTEGNLVVTNGQVEKLIIKANDYYVCYTKTNTSVSKDRNELTDCLDMSQNIVYKETILNGADPVVSGDLIPVTIANDGTVTKADINTKWYSYQDKVWANAVILTDTGKVEEDGTILESSIESYFVWVPRYRYELFAPENYASVIEEKPTQSIAKTINIVFESKETAVSDGTNNWLTHPAFTAFNTNGIWVGKYETGYKGATTTEEANTNTNISDRSKVIIKPNVYSWRNINVANMFTTSLSYNTNLNSHMMKNTEWGAVAYLSHSQYGINAEININNNENYVTGYSSTETADQLDYPGTSGTTEDVTLAYNTETGYKASTTGNISGIYDMSGGSHEYVAAYINEIYGNSGFTAETIGRYDIKYFDIYPSNSTKTSYSNRILGDATGEMGPFYNYQDGDKSYKNHNSWYNDNTNFIDSSTFPWFLRGGYFYSGVLAGQFYFSVFTGDIYNYLSFRIVLANN